MSMPIQKPGKSKQDYRTPPEFIAAVKRRLHIDNFWIDLAADKDNAVANLFYSEEDSAFDNPWGMYETAGQWAWCNPPYNDIQPWVYQASLEAKLGANIAMLLPASVGSNYWKEYVEPYAYQSFLNGRLTFIGCDASYPKDCALLLYTPWGFTGHEIWSWNG